MDSAQKISEFWDWFSANQHRYLFLKEISTEEKDNLMNELLNELHKYCDHLYFEIGGHDEDSQVELVVTAEGIVEYFPMVETLIDRAPQLKDWRFVKFRQPQGPGYSIQSQGIKFDPAKTIFIPFKIENPKDVAIQVCYSEYEDEKRDDFINGTYIMLDTLIGEKSTTLDIQVLEIIPTPENIADFDFMHLSEIEQYIAETKGNTRHTP